MKEEATPGAHRVTEEPPSRSAVSPFAGGTSRDSSFAAGFDAVFRTYHDRVFSYIQRLCGEPDLAADITQETFVRLYRRGNAAELTVPWLITVATNLLRNVRSRAARRLQLLAAARVPEDELVAPNAVDKEEQARVRKALERLSPRDRQLLSLLAGGFTYREMAAACGLNEASVGTMLSRAKRAFREHYGADDSTP